MVGYLLRRNTWRFLGVIISFWCSSKNEETILKNRGGNAITNKHKWKRNRKFRGMKEDRTSNEIFIIIRPNFTFFQFWKFDFPLGVVNFRKVSLTFHFFQLNTLSSEGTYILSHLPTNKANPLLSFRNNGWLWYAFTSSFSHFSQDKLTTNLWILLAEPLRFSSFLQYLLLSFNQVVCWLWWLLV